MTHFRTRSPNKRNARCAKFVKWWITSSFGQPPISIRGWGKSLKIEFNYKNSTTQFCSCLLRSQNPFMELSCLSVCPSASTITLARIRISRYNFRQRGSNSWSTGWVRTWASFVAFPVLGICFGTLICYTAYQWWRVTIGSIPFAMRRLIRLL